MKWVGRKREGLGRVTKRSGGEYGQNTLYEILEELIKNIISKITWNSGIEL